MARPNWSVPHQDCGHGGEDLAEMRNWMGSFEAIIGQATAHTIDSPTTMAPTIAVGERRNASKVVSRRRTRVPPGVGRPGATRSDWLRTASGAAVSTDSWLT